MNKICTEWLVFAIITCLTVTAFTAPATHTRRTVKNRSLMLYNPIKDIVDLHINLLSLTSVKVLACAAPVYALARAFDERIHHCFYDKEQHKNIHQFHDCCHWLSSRGLGIPIVLCAGFSLFSQHEQARLTGYFLLIGLPFVIFGKDLLKCWEAPHCLRPRNEHFDRHHRAHGGFPSGHMAQAMYMTVLFGKRYGPIAWVPLGLYSGFLLATFTNCNRHYVSQMVAGAALGAMYALAADKLINTKLARSLEISGGVSAQGKGYVQAGIRF
jgi:PAP2 superfamily protein